MPAVKNVYFMHWLPLGVASFCWLKKWIWRGKLRWVASLFVPLRHTVLIQTVYRSVVHSVFCWHNVQCWIQFSEKNQRHNIHKRMFIFYILQRFPAVMSTSPHGSLKFHPIISASVNVTNSGSVGPASHIFQQQLTFVRLQVLWWGDL